MVFPFFSLLLENEEVAKTGGLLRTFMTIKKPAAVNTQTIFSNEEDIEGIFPAFPRGIFKCMASLSAKLYRLPSMPK